MINKKVKCNIPKKIFIFWADGYERAPNIVKVCISSWEYHNPDWEVIIIDWNNLRKYIGPVEVPADIFDRLPIQKKANLIRLKLLLYHGGVWADATSYCTKPLNDWIFENTKHSGVFMFSDPGKDRMIANWFIAASKDNYLIKTLYKERCNFWTKYNFPHTNYFQRKWVPFLCRVINRNHWLPMLWFNPIFTRILKVYPYLIFHYGFFKLYKSDKTFAELWDKTIKKDAYDSLKPGWMKFSTMMDEEKKLIIDNLNPVLLKLSHKKNLHNLQKESILNYLFNKYPIERS